MLIIGVRCSPTRYQQMATVDDCGSLPLAQPYPRVPLSRSLARQCYASPPMALARINANNHIITAPCAYDAAGNETADTALMYTWNAEGELKNHITDSIPNRS